MGVRDGLDYMYAGVVRSVNVELLQRQLQDFFLFSFFEQKTGVFWELRKVIFFLVQKTQEGAIVSMTPLGSSPGGEVFFVSSEELLVEEVQIESTHVRRKPWPRLAAKVASRLQAIKLVSGLEFQLPNSVAFFRCRGVHHQRPMPC